MAIFETYGWYLLIPIVLFGTGILVQIACANIGIQRLIENEKRK
jgi:hypothetical protein